MRYRWLAVGAALATVSLAVACGASETSSRGDQPVATASSASGGGGCTSAAGASGLESILALVPDTAPNREWLLVGDLEAYLAEQGKELPGDFDDIRWADPVNLFMAGELFANAMPAADETNDPLADELGLELGQIDQTVSAGLPPDSTEMVIGSFDPATVDEVVGADPFWSEQEETVEAHGATYYSWGDDNEFQIGGRSPIRDLGIGGRLWVDERVAVFTRATEPMEAFLAGCAGAEPTLADDDDYAGIAERLDDFDGAYNVTFTDQVRGPDDVGVGADGSEGTGAADDPAPLDGISVYGFASGPSDDPEIGRMRLVLAAGSEEQAAANEELFADRVEQGSSASSGVAWSKELTVERIEVDGRFLIVELSADRSTILMDELLRRDSLIVSDG